MTKRTWIDLFISLKIGSRVRTVKSIEAKQYTRDANRKVSKGLMRFRGGNYSLIFGLLAGKSNLDLTVATFPCSLTKNGGKILVL